MNPAPHGRVLVVDDHDANVALIGRLLVAAGFEVRATLNANEALAAVAREQPDVVLMDVRMPRHSGFELCQALKRNAATKLVPVVLMTASSEQKDRLDAIEAGADDFVTKPLNLEELKARLKSLIKVKRFTDDLDNAEHVILSLALTIEARDEYTEGHCQRLASYGVALGTALGLDRPDLTALHRGGYLHDIGKIGIPDAILRKPSSLTPEEFALMRTHPIIGERLCGDLRLLARVRPIVRHHHERFDGSGYPDGLRGDAIPLLAQIVGIVDVFDALTSNRPYRRALSFAAACEELHHEAGMGWRRRDVVTAFVQLVAEGQIGAPAARLGPAEGVL
jgi:putative two-component system response regulator